MNNRVLLRSSFSAGVLACLAFSIHYLPFTIHWVDRLTKKTVYTYIEIPLLGGRLTVGLRTLNPPIGVRIPASQPMFIPKSIEARVT